ncbi:uncharacterized protein [Rutidosis leptorrhynchoides]|uniref:uncharacterized protein n=1 Tax=Rutidosis leptorrhynchoides TaxID=125765 RepID=UPI003A991077
MELRFRTHVMHILLIMLLWLQLQVESQSVLNVSEIRSARALDPILQDYAYRALNVSPKTGVSFDGSVPKNLTGIQVSALRLRSGSLFTRGVPMYKEFKIPKGVIEEPYVERLVFVYQNLGNWSTKFYTLPGYMYLAPVLGLLAYDAADLTAKSLTELDIEASVEPILIDFERVRPVPDGLTARCVWIDLNGEVNFTNVVSGNRCLAYKHGHFSIVVKSTTPEIWKLGHKSGGIDSSVWVIVGCIVGACLLLVLLALLIVCVRGYKRRKKMNKMERAAEGGEPLRMTMIGSIKAPAAMVTRTQPTLETEYAP